nr:hypothetical protein [Pseudonocardia kunmingensis]
MRSRTSTAAGPAGTGAPPTGSCGGRQQGADALQRAQPGLHLWQLVAHVAQLPHERGDQQPQGDQLGQAEPAAAHQRGAGHGERGEHPVQHQAGAPPDPGGGRAGGRHPAQHLMGAPGVLAHHVRLAERGADVVAPGHRLLELRGVVGPGGLLGELALGHHAGERADQHRGEQGDEREGDPRRPPGEPGDDPGERGAQDGRAHRPPGAPHQHPELAGVVVDAVEHLADGLVLQSGQRLVQRRVQQVGAQPALGAPDDPGERGAPHGVEQGAAEQQDGQQGHRARGGSRGDAARDDGGERLGRRGEHGEGDGDARGALGQPSPVQWLRAHVAPVPCRPARAEEAVDLVDPPER